MIRIAIAPAAFDVIAATLPLGSVAFEPQLAANGERAALLSQCPTTRRHCSQLCR
jgi:hypothetical protein